MAFPFLPVAKIGLGLLGSFLGAKQQGRANELSEEGLEFARQDIASRGRFRDQLFASLQEPQLQREDLSGLFRSANPFAAPQESLAPIGGAPMGGIPPQMPPIGQAPQMVPKPQPPINERGRFQLPGAQDFSGRF